MDHSSNTEKLLYLESIRGIAAMSVVLFHGNFIVGMPITGNHYILQSYLMVDLFFVLSGFVIAYNYYDRITSITNLCVFQLRRFLRLYPLHFVTLLAFVGIEILKYLFEHQTGVAADNAAFSKNNLPAFFNNLLLLQSFGKKLTFNFPSWSISTEFYTYLVFAVLILLIRNEAWRRILLMISIVAAGWTLFTHHVGDTTTGLAIVRCIYAFFIGALMWVFLKNKTIRMSSKFSNTIVPLVFAAIFFNDVIIDQFYPLLFAIMIFSLYTSEQGIIKKILSDGKLVFLGTVSYGIYMWSAAVWWVIKNALQYGFKVPTVIFDGEDYLSLNLIPATLVILAGVTIILIVAWFSYTMLEKPINNYRHNLPFKN